MGWLVSGKDPVDFGERVVEVVKDSGQALLVKTVSGKEFWVPQSVIHEDSEVYKEGTKGKLIVHKWWARKGGWIE